MRFHTPWIIATTILMFTGCAFEDKEPQAKAYDPKISPDNPETNEFKYAFSAQVKDGSTREAIKDFTVEVVGSDPALSAIINGMGDRQGLFHLSRNPSFSDDLEKPMNVLISAPGYQSRLQSLRVGSDCRALRCRGFRPRNIFLRRSNITEDSLDEYNSQAYLPSWIRRKTDTQNIGKIFGDLTKSGKITGNVTDLLSGANNGDTLSNILVDLQSNTNVPANTFGSLLNSTRRPFLNSFLQTLPTTLSSLLPMLSSGSPEIAAAMVAAKVLLPYLQNRVDQMGSNTGRPLARMLSSFLGGSNFNGNIASLFSGLGSGSSQSQLLAGFLPIAQGLLSQRLGSGSERPFANLLAKSLGDPALMQLILNQGSNLSKEERWKALMPYIQSLVQGLSGKNSDVLLSLFNELVSGGDPIAALKNLPMDSKRLEKFSRLLPLIDPLLSGLNGKHSDVITSFLEPYLNQADPGNALRDLLSGQTGSDSKSSMANLISGFFPAFDDVLEGAVPSKELLAAQLIQGLINGDLKNLKVVQDLPGASSVVVEGSARDIFKLAQLPNIKRVSTVNE